MGTTDFLKGKLDILEKILEDKIVNLSSVCFGGTIGAMEFPEVKELRKNIDTLKNNPDVLSMQTKTNLYGLVVGYSNPYSF